MPDTRVPLTVSSLQLEAARFAQVESTHDEPTLYGVTDGKAVGTYLEHKFQAHLLGLYLFARGSSAKGIDIPDLNRPAEGLWAGLFAPNFRLPEVG